MKEYYTKREVIEVYREVTDKQAEKEIRNFILFMKECGRNKIDIIDLVEELKLPPE